MTLRIALFADVHGNRWAMEAVYEAICRAKPDMVVFLGDAVLRVPGPAECMAMIRQLADVSVRGNYDWFITGGFPNEARRFTEEPFLPHEIAWTKSKMTADDVDYIKNLPLTVRLFSGTPQAITVCHASPGKAFGGLFPPEELHHWGMTDEACRPLLKGEPASFIVCGHTHAVMDRTVDRWRIVNPGSVTYGWNDKDRLDALARWALLTWSDNDWQVTFHTESYDNRAVWDAYEKWSLWPMLRQYDKPAWWGDQARRFAHQYVG